MAYTKTEWVNGETPINESNLNNIENGIEAVQPQTITIRTSAEESFGAGLNYYYLSKLDDIFSSCGDLFKEIGTAQASGSATSITGLKIPTGVNKINVSGQVQFTNDNTTSTMYFMAAIYKVNADGEATELSRSMSTAVPITTNNVVTLTFAEVKGVEVAEGDIIGLRVYKSVANGLMTVGVGSRVYLSVEKAE